MSKELELDHQYQKYLKKMQLPEDKMNHIQRVETKRAFYGGCTQLLDVVFNTVAAVEDQDRAIGHLEDLQAQTEIFWKEQLNLRTTF